jgi:two-component system response regulator Irr
MNILIAENNDIFRKSLSYFLELQGFIVDQFNDGKEALQAIIGKRYNIILTDLNMPGASGTAITKYIRQNLQSDIPIIIFTPSSIQQTEFNCLEFGANDFISKVVSPSILLTRIEKLLQKN